MAQEQEPQHEHAAGQHQHGEEGDSMQMLVVRLLLAASQTSEPVASELKDIAMTLSCATMAARDGSSSASVKDEPASTRGDSAAPSLGVLTDGTSAPPDSRDGSTGDSATSTALLLRGKAPPTTSQGTLPPTQSQQNGFEPTPSARSYPIQPGPQPGLQLDFGQRSFPSAGAKRSYPFEDANLSEHKRQQTGFSTGPPGRRPVCRECFGAGLAGSCDHTARCNNCKARGGVNCVYVACMQGMGCTDPQCYFMHPDQWHKNDRPVWQLKTSHLPLPQGAPAPEPRPLPPPPKQWRKNNWPQNRTPWAPPRQTWSFGGVTVTSDQPINFKSNRSFQPAITGTMTPTAPQAGFNPPQSNFASQAYSAPFVFPKAENGVSNAGGGSASVATTATEFPRGLLKYENDE